MLSPRSGELINSQLTLRTTPNDPDMDAAAVLAVLGRAADLADADELLQMLGLAPPSGGRDGDWLAVARALHAERAVRRSTGPLGASTGVPDA